MFWKKHQMTMCKTVNAINLSTVTEGQKSHKLKAQPSTKIMD